MVIRSGERAAAAALLAALFACSHPVPAHTPSKTGDSNPANPQHVTAPVKALSVRPESLAAVEHRGLEARLVLVDVPAGKATKLAHLAADVRWLDWTPDGSQIVYLAGRQLRVNRVAGSQDAALAEGVSAQARAPFAISPDNRLIAVVAGSDIRLAPVAALPAFQPLVRVRMPSGCALVDLRWSPTSDSLLMLCYPAPGAKISQLLRIDAASGKMQTLPSPVKRLLGWRQSGQLVVVREGPAFDEAALLNPDGSMLAWGTRREPSEAYILDYAQGPGLVLEVTPSEDPGDPVSAYLRPAGDGPVRPWLRRYPRLTDIKFSLDGTRATFADRRTYGAGGMPGGDIYVVDTGREDARLVVRGAPGVRSYSSPALRP